MLPVEESEMRKRGFTLVELLVVIGIIAVLLSLLIPSLSRAREQAKRATCAANLHSVSQAFISYAAENDETFPAGARNAIKLPDDWVWWQISPVRGIEKSAIARYLAQPMDVVLTCPSDDRNYRARTKTGGKYIYSYVMNSFMTVAPPPGSQVSHGIRLSKVKNPSQKAIVYEEDFDTIDDGFGTPDVGSGINLLSIRHDVPHINDIPGNPLRSFNQNIDASGNVGFCDGHVDYIARRDFHKPATYDPNF